MTQFQVSLFHAITDPVPFATLPIIAKMPLGALVFAMHQAHETRMPCVDVAYGGGERTTFYHVVLDSQSITYDREVLIVEKSASNETE